MFNLTDELNNLIDDYMKDNPHADVDEVRGIAAMIVYTNSESDSLYKDIAKCFYTNMK